MRIIVCLNVGKNVMKYQIKTWDDLKLWDKLSLEIRLYMWDNCPYRQIRHIRFNNKDINS